MDGAGGHPLFRRHSTKRDFSTMAASHRDAEDDASSSLFLSPIDDHYDNDRPARRRRLEVEGLALPRLAVRPPRYPGDGLDYRRPVSSSVTSAAAAPVIDLTDDDHTESQDTEASAVSTAAVGRSSRAQRGPRFGRNIIDIAGSDNEEEERSRSRPRRGVSAARDNNRPQYSVLRRLTRPPSPPAEMDDIEFVAERSLSRPMSMSRGHSPAVPSAPRSITPYPTGFEPIDLTNDDDVVHLNTRPRDGINAARPGATAGVGTRSVIDRGFGHMGHIADILRGEGANIGGRLMQRLQFAGTGMEGELRAQQQAFDHFQHNHRHHHDHHHHHTHHRAGVPQHLRFVPVPPRGINLPDMMDYGTAAFGLGLPADGPMRPPTPKYSPPPEPNSGFTRSPTEDEVVVCPNCGDELAVGESEAKQKVWVVKACGHAYCGECAQNRVRTVSKKGKGKATDLGLPPPFKKCVVDGCGKPTTKNSMIPVFLGS